MRIFAITSRDPLQQGDAESRKRDESVRITTVKTLRLRHQTVRTLGFVVFGPCNSSFHRITIRPGRRFCEAERQAVRLARKLKREWHRPPADSTRTRRSNP